MHEPEDITDTDRLDWLQKRYASAVFNPHMNFYQICDHVEGDNLAADIELRAAIDAAIRSSASHALSRK